VAEPVSAVVVLEVDDDAVLVRLVVPPVEAALGIGHVVDERAVVPLRRAARRLDQDNLGSVVGEEPAAEGGVLARELDDAQAIERARPIGRLGNALGRAVDTGIRAFAHRLARAQITPSLRRSSISVSVSPSTSPYT